MGLEEGTSNLIVFSVPLFFAAIGLEVLVHALDAHYNHSQRLIVYFRKKNYYRLNDSINSLSCGTAQVLVSSFHKGLKFYPYVWVHEHFGLFNFADNSVIASVLAFLLVDLMYYCKFRGRSCLIRTSNFVGFHFGSHKAQLAVVGPSCGTASTLYQCACLLG